MKIKNTEYRQQNKELIKIKLAEKITCECGCQIAKRQIGTHRKSKKHLNIMEELKMQPKVASLVLTDSV